MFDARERLKFRLKDKHKTFFSQKSFYLHLFRFVLAPREIYNCNKIPHKSIAHSLHTDHLLWNVSHNKYSFWDKLKYKSCVCIYNRELCRFQRVKWNLAVDSTITVDSFTTSPYTLFTMSIYKHIHCDRLNLSIYGVKGKKYYFVP